MAYDIRYIGNKFTLFYPVQGVLNSVEYLVNDSLNATKY